MSVAVAEKPSKSSTREDVRNIAIIAHVDHGKTTLVDQLLRQSGTFRANQVVQDRVLDSNDLERERGITILAKNTSVIYRGVKINIIDTPGHSDFGGEVERVLKMANGVLVLVDAVEGPMPQTTFVLKKALEYHLPSIVVINKIDREAADPQSALNKVFDLYVDLDADEELLDFPVIYANALTGKCKREMADELTDLQPLFEEILKSVPAPQGLQDAPFQMLVSSLDYNDYVGRFGIGRIFQGTVQQGDLVSVVSQQGDARAARIVNLYGFNGLERQAIETAGAGDIVAVSGIEGLNITDTLTHPDHPRPVSTLPIEEPTVQMMFTINSGPFSGQEGEFVTSRQLRTRLYRELETNLALRVKDGATKDEFQVSGRGLMHLGILIENMRREGFELLVGKPKVIYKEIHGRTCEPYETAVVDAPSDALGPIMQLMGQRGGEAQKVDNIGNHVQLHFSIPSRGLMGLRPKLLSATRGEAILYHNFSKYGQVKSAVLNRAQGVLVSADQGSVTAYALEQLRQRGQFLVKPKDRVYAGMIVGEHCEDRDLVVRVTREKKQTNIRAASAERLVVLQEPMDMSLEAALEYIEDDEWVEVTPESIRLRKKILDEKVRKRKELTEKA